MAAPATEIPAPEKEKEESESAEIPVRSVVTSVILAVVFNVIACKLSLTAGVIPALNVAAGLLGFAYIVKAYTRLKQPFNWQEKTVIQTPMMIARNSGTLRDRYRADIEKIAAHVKNLDHPWMFGLLVLVTLLATLFLMLNVGFRSNLGSCRRQVPTRPASPLGFSYFN